jgi:hypothetical protein
LLLRFALEYAIKKVHQNQKVLEFNGTHHLLVYADDVNILSENLNTVKKNKEVVLGLVMRWMQRNPSIYLFLVTRMQGEPAGVVWSV